MDCPRRRPRWKWCERADEAHQEEALGEWPGGAWPAGRKRTGDILIQSLLPGISLARHVLTVRQASIGRRIGVSQVPIPKGSDAHSENGKSLLSYLGESDSTSLSGAAQPRDPGGAG